MYKNEVSIYKFKGIYLSIVLIRNNRSLLVHLPRIVTSTSILRPVLLCLADSYPAFAWLAQNCARRCAMDLSIAHSIGGHFIFESSLKPLKYSHILTMGVKIHGYWIDVLPTDSMAHSKSKLFDFESMCASSFILNLHFLSRSGLDAYLYSICMTCAAQRSFLGSSTWKTIEWTD